MTTPRPPCKRGLHDVDSGNDNADGGGGGGADNNEQFSDDLMMPDLEPLRRVASTDAATVSVEGTRHRPLVRLTEKLIKVYNEINTRELSRRNKGGQDYKFRHGEVLNQQYKLLSLLGSGSFSQVIRAEDLANSRSQVALKIVKTGNPYQHQATVEISILTELREKDPNDEYNIIRLQSSFEHSRHQCIVLEHLSINLYQYLKNTRHPTNKTRFFGVSLNLVRTFGKQLLKTISFLCRPDVGIIHCDLKPENILLRDLNHCLVKVVDFGSSCRSNDLMYAVVQSRFYRAPEVFLGMKYGTPIDMWSLGCMLVEMHTGSTLFQGRTDEQQLYKIIDVLGMIPSPMVERARPSNRDMYFEEKQQGDAIGGHGADKDKWVLRQCSPPGGVSSQPNNACPSNSELSRRIRVKQDTETSSNYDKFEDLVRRMLQLDPNDRVSADDALAHSFFDLDPSQQQQQQQLSAVPSPPTNMQ